MAARSARRGSSSTPTCRRMLMTMKTQIEAMRALACTAAGALDRAEREPDPQRAPPAKADLPC